MSYALFKRNILIVITDLCFGRRGVNRLRQFIGFFQSFRKFNATDFSGFLIALPATSCDISANDALDWQHLQFPAHHTVTVELFLLEEFRHIFHIYRNHVIRNDILCHVKPELGHLCQDSSFFGHFIVQNHIKTADTICSYHDQAVTVIINLTYFSFFNRFHFLHFTHLILFFLDNV